MLPARIARSAALFLVTIACLATAAQATTPPSFTLHLSQYLTVGTQPLSAATGDFNQDGFQDIVVANHGSASVSVLLGKGDGTFHTPVNYTVPAGAYGVTVGDFNGDGVLDIAVTSTSAKNVTILLGNGDGTFKTPGKSFSTGGESFAIAAGDVSGDGKVDLVVANYDTGKVGVLLGNGDGTFQAVLSFAAGSNARALALGDFNQDGKLDLAVANEFEGTVTVLLGNGDGTFNPGIPYPLLGLGASSIAVGDFYGNGFADLLVANDAATGGDIELLPNTGSGTFGTAVSLGAAGGTVPISVVAADFNGDNTWDAAFALKGSTMLAWLAGDGNGAFTSETTAATGSGPFFVATADFNGDGIADVVVVNSTANSIYVFTAVPSAAPVAPQLWLSASQLNFGDELIGVPSRKLAVQLRYTGAGPLPITSIAVSSGYTETTDCGTSLPAGAICTIEVDATPAAGTNNGLILISYASSLTATVNLYAYGTSQLLQSSGGLKFPIEPVGATSPPENVSFMNISGHGVVISSIVASANFAQTNNCGSYLEAQASCTVQVTFTPASVGTKNGTITVYSGTTAIGTGSLTGVGSLLEISPSSVTFPTQPFGTQSTPVTVAVKNLSSSYTIYLDHVLVSAPFTAINHCGHELAPATSCDQTITYTPTAVGAQNGAVTVYSNATLAGTVIQTAPLSGSGTAATPKITLTVSPTSITIGAIATLTATVTTGTQPVVVGSVTFLDGPRILGTVQVVRKTSGGFALGTATLRTGAFRAGTHSITARYNANAGLPMMTSTASSLVVTFTGSAATTSSTLSSAGSPGAYSLTADGLTMGSIVPTGSLSVVDQTLGNTVISQQSLTPAIFTPSLRVSGLISGAASPIVTGDFNGDGFPDVAAISYTPQTGPGNLYVALGKGDGTLNPAASYTLPPFMQGLVAADFDGDGRLDLAVIGGTQSAQTLSIYFGNGNGTFQAPVVHNIGNYPRVLVAGDFFGDGLVDLVWTNGAGQVLTARNNFDGTIALPGSWVASCYPDGMAPISFVPGGPVNLLISCPNVGGGAERGVFIYAFFGPGPYFTSLSTGGTGPVAVGDFNQDGKNDFIVGNWVLLGNGDGTFQSPKAIAPSSSLSAIALADLRGNGVLDLIGLPYGDNPFSVLVFAGDGAGNFVQTSASYPVGSTTYAMAVADFNNDGTPDLALGYSGTALFGQFDAEISLPNFGIAGTGTHNIVAKYSGDTHYAASQSSALALTEGVPNFGAYSINYGTITHGTQRILNVRLYNASSSSITFALGFSPTSSPFAIATGTSCGTSLAASASCTVQISFTPPTAGTYNATLSATGSSGSASVALTGNAN